MSGVGDRTTTKAHRLAAKGLVSSGMRRCPVRLSYLHVGVVGETDAQAAGVEPEAHPTERLPW